MRFQDLNNYLLICGYFLDLSQLAFWQSQFRSALSDSYMENTSAILDTYIENSIYLLDHKCHSHKTAIIRSNYKQVLLGCLKKLLKIVKLRILYSCSTILCHYTKILQKLQFCFSYKITIYIYTSSYN